MQNIKSLLENINFLNNQNYVVGRFGKSQVFSNYLKLNRYVKFYSILKEFNSNKIYVFIIGLFPFMLGGLAYVDEFILKSSSGNIVGFVLLSCLGLLLPILYYFFVKTKYLYLNLKLKDIFFVKLLNKSLYGYPTLSFSTIGIRYVFGLILFFLFFIILMFYGFYYYKKIIYTLFFLFPILFIFVKVENIIPYFIFNILSEFEYYINFIIYFINKNKLTNKIFIINPINSKMNKILDIKDDIVYTNTAIVKK